jgi:hypothetical protein
MEAGISGTQVMPLADPPLWRKIRKGILFHEFLISRFNQSYPVPKGLQARKRLELPFHLGYKN